MQLSPLFATQRAQHARFMPAAFVSAVFVAFALTLSGCGGSGASSGADPAPRAESDRSWSFEWQQGPLHWDAELHRMALRGAACADELLNYEVLLKAGPEEDAPIWATSQTEWAVDEQHVCASRKRFSAYRLQWSEQAHPALLTQGAVLELRQHTELVHRVTLAPLQDVLSEAAQAAQQRARIVLEHNDASKGVAGFFCAQDGVPFIRGRLQQPDWLLPLTTQTPHYNARLDCDALPFEASPALLQQQAVTQHWFSGDALTLWQGSAAPFEATAPVAAVAWRAHDRVHTFDFIEAGANEQEDMLRMPFEPTGSLYPARGRPQPESLYEAGMRQGHSAVTERAAGRQAWGRLQLLGLDKRLNTTNPAQSLAEFSRGYRDAGGVPSTWYVLDEPFWKSFGDVVEPHLQAAHLLDYRAVVAAYRQEWPGVPLMAAVNGVVLKTQVVQDARALLADVDVLAFDPYTVYSSLLPSLYADGLRDQSRLCPVQAWDRLDVAASRCLAKTMLSRPGQKAGWVVQGFLVNEKNLPEFLTYPVHAHSLQRHWRAMRQVALEHADQTQLLAVFGFRLSQHSLVNEPLLIRGADLQNLAPLHEDLKSLAAR